MTICIHRNLNALRNGRKVPLSEDGGHIWSLKGYKSPKTLGKLQGHHDPLTDGTLTLFDCVWRVSTAGVNQVKKRGRRQVCAWIEASESVDANMPMVGLAIGRLSYNPMVDPETAHIVNDAGDVIRVIQSGDELGMVQATQWGLFVY